MALTYETIADEARSIPLHTGLSKEEFEHMLAAFPLEWEHYMWHCTWCLNSFKIKLKLKPINSYST